MDNVAACVNPDYDYIKVVHTCESDDDVDEYKTEIFKVSELDGDFSPALGCCEMANPYSYVRYISNSHNITFGSARHINHASSVDTALKPVQIYGIEF
jgi:hypothetical protein